MSFVTLLTDFGIRDGAANLMKGVIWRIAPDAKIADLSHTIGAQNLQEAAIVLRFGFPYFPAGTVHIVVVDPGVGTQRRPLAARLGDQYFVGPDNGVVSLVLELVEKAGGTIQFVHTDKPAYWLPEVSTVFHGRDIFSPVGAHLAAGVPLEALGTAIDDPVRFSLNRPEPTPSGLRGEIIFIDDFGNLHTNILETDLAALPQTTVTLRGARIEGIVKTFGSRPIGSLIAHIGTEHDLCIAVVNGNAAAQLGGQVGDIVEIVT
ncbi:MAG: SAM-dependent chlorinase/fluorinase [Anaerolineales bacterium]|nr:SAM-dependent chlorinase/fluorinase [Anaerolineales bacterium]